MRGFCSRCGKQVGGALKPQLWQCPKCRAVLCADCTSAKRVGLLFKKPVCPDCLLELAEGGLASFATRAYSRREPTGGRINPTPSRPPYAV